jgi:hypothetical protein
MEMMKDLKIPISTTHLTINQKSSSRDRNITTYKQMRCEVLAEKNTETIVF